MGKSDERGNMENNTRWQEFNSIVDNRELNAKEKLLLITIFRFYNPEKGYSFPSKETLKELCSITQDRDYYKYIKGLEDKELLIKETIQGRGCKFYLTHCQNDSDLQNDSNTHCQNDSRPTCKMTVQKENKRKLKEYINLAFIDDVVDKVRISQEQYSKLVDKFSVELVNSQILALDNYITNGKGNKYKDHYRVLNTWCIDKQPKIIPGQISIEDNGIREF